MILDNYGSGLVYAREGNGAHNDGDGQGNGPSSLPSRFAGDGHGSGIGSGGSYSGGDGYGIRILEECPHEEVCDGTQ